MEPSLWIAAQVRNLYPGSNLSGLLRLGGGQGGHKLKVLGMGKG
jgi:hypothetical protein